MVVLFGNFVKFSDGVFFIIILVLDDFSVILEDVKSLTNIVFNFNEVIII